MDRSKHLKRLKTQVFDCLIIGGGASGTGCALDSTLRGYTTALIEKEDFAAATSSKSTKLIHGGVRYLEQAFKNLDLAQLNQVRHGLSERHTLLRNAPHLAQALPLLTPVFGWFEGLYYSLGLNLYDFVATEEDLLPDSEWVEKEESLARMPVLSDKVEGAVTLSEQMSATVSDVSTGILNVTDNIQNVAAAIEEQVSASESISDSAQDLHQSSETQSEDMAKTREDVAHLQQQIDSLNEELVRFRV